MTPPKLLSISLVAKGTSRHDRSVLPSLLESRLLCRRVAKLPSCRAGMVDTENDDASVQSAWRNLDLAAGGPERRIRGGVPTRPGSLEASSQPINNSQSSREHARGSAPSRNSRGCWGLRVRGPSAVHMTSESRRPRPRSQRCRVTPSVTGVGPGSRVRAGSLAARGCQHAAGSVPRARTMACSGLPCNRPTAADSLRCPPLIRAVR